MQLYIGTSGWNYPHWRKRFYPRGLTTSRWLSYLAQHYNTTEINSSFYRIPRPEYVQRWAAQVPRRFRFAMKMWRGVTQYKRLVDCREELEAFFAAFQLLPSRNRGPVLVQLPPSLESDLATLDRFLRELRAVTSPARWKVAVEFRHQSWLNEETYRLLDRHRATICLHDMKGRAPTDQPNHASFVYVRRHGPKRGYRGSYSTAALKADAVRIHGWLAEGRAVFVYFNNDVEGHALNDAHRLRSLVAQLSG